MYHIGTWVSFIRCTWIQKQKNQCFLFVNKKMLFHLIKWYMALNQMKKQKRVKCKRISLSSLCQHLTRSTSRSFTVAECFLNDRWERLIQIFIHYIQANSIMFIQLRCKNVSKVAMGTGQHVSSIIFPPLNVQFPQFSELLLCPWCEAQTHRHKFLVAVHPWWTSCSLTCLHK